MDVDCNVDIVARDEGIEAIMVQAIDFCIPFVGNGIRYLEYLINNIERTANQPQRINFIVSYHTDSDFSVLQKSPIYRKISQTVRAPAFNPGMAFHASANHASAINALAKASSADIVIFSDYDMAFVYRDWDNLIERYFFVHNLHLCGVSYSCFWLKILDPLLIESIPIIKNNKLMKYQNLPNLSFFCIKGDTLRTIFASQLTGFDSFLASGGLPFRIISTPQLAAENNLPLGTLQWLDTGYEIPEMIQKHNIPYAVFPHVMLEQQSILKYSDEYDQLSAITRPEVFYCPAEPIPFLCHFKKGTLKSEDNNVDIAFSRFTDAVDSFLKVN